MENPKIILDKITVVLVSPWLQDKWLRGYQHQQKTWERTLSGETLSGGFGPPLMTT
jgi:hypothetical protein